MYDILQLNEMLVPELLDIAEELNIPNAKKMDKQELVYKILDSQAIAGAKTGAATDDKNKRKRIIKASTGITTEEAVVEENNNEKKSPKKHIPMPAKKDDKGPVKRTRKKIEDKEHHEPAIEQTEEIAEPNNE